MTTTSKFEPEEGAAYGKCETCGEEIPTQADYRVHQDTVMAANKGQGHRVLLLNQTREQRILNAARDLVDEAVRTAVDELDELVVDDHITREEATEAIRQFSDFADHWREEGLDKSIDPTG
jgi:hypothetical protein